MTTYGAIPTVYKNVQFRSRLEARWACYFDLLGWLWQYEPVDLPGYIPDFLVNDDSDSPDDLVEVKPALDVQGLSVAAQKIDGAGWNEPGFSYVVGHNPTIGIMTVAGIGAEDRWAPIGAWDFDPRIERMEQLLGRELEDHECAPGTWKESLWREAGNRVQWKAPR